jgi:hypothetical protein
MATFFKFRNVALKYAILGATGTSSRSISIGRAILPTVAPDRSLTVSQTSSPCSEETAFCCSESICSTDLGRSSSQPMLNLHRVKGRRCVSA